MTLRDRRAEGFAGAALHAWSMGALAQFVPNRTFRAAHRMVTTWEPSRHDSNRGPPYPEFVRVEILCMTD